MMSTVIKKPEDMSWADIRATLAEATLLSKENEKELKELKKSIAETNKGIDKMYKSICGVKEELGTELEKNVAETSKNIDKMYKSICGVKEELGKELDVSIAETSRGIDKLRKSVRGVKEELGGISTSNGMYAEDYFYASLRETKMFGGVHFDDVEQNVGGMLKFKDGTKLRGQFDVVLYNDTAICLIEVKYRLRKEDILKAIEKDVDNFKKLFPVYEKYKFYLAVGGMAIDDKVIETAEQYGVGVVKLMGGKVEILDKNLKVY
jgi:uncharacterized coiled-coil protein SlyX